MNTLRILTLTCLILTLTACVPVEERTEEPAEEVVVETEVIETVPKAEIGGIVASELEKDFEYYLSCDNNKFPFKEGELGQTHGQAVFTGIISENIEENFWAIDGTNLVVIRMLVEDSDIPEAIQYYEEMANDGNTVNRFEGDKLGFKLGTLENGELSSTANISSGAHNEILNALETGEEISLTLTHSYNPGMGAPPSFSFACEIELVQ